MTAPTRRAWATGMRARGHDAGKWNDSRRSGASYVIEHANGVQRELTLFRAKRAILVGWGMGPMGRMGRIDGL
jgi:hypothetical protein